MKIKITVMLLLINLFLASCVNVDFILDIKKDYNTNLQIRCTYQQKDIYESIEKTILQNIKGYEYKSIDNGFILNKSFNISDLKDSGGIILPVSDYSAYVKNYFFYRKYILNTNFSLEEIIKKYQGTLFLNLYNKIPKDVLEKININLVLKTPINLTNSNGIKEKDNITVWKISLKSNNKIHIEKDIPNVKNIIITIIFVILSVVFYIKIKLKMKKHNKIYKY